MSTFRQVSKLREFSLKNKKTSRLVTGITFKILHSKTSIGSAMVSQVYTHF